MKHEENWRNDALAPSSADAEEIQQYCYGECHVFAVALHRLTGWSMHLILDNAESFWSSDDGEDNIPTTVHILCLDDNENFWDVRGSRPRDTLLEEMMGWHPIEDYGSDTHCNEDDIRHYTGYWGEDGVEIDRPLSEFTEADVAVAMEVARKALADVPGFSPTCTPAI